MALRTPLSVTPHLYMGDSTGRPLDMGTVYFGEQDKDPEFYPIELFSDDALTLPLAQPVHTKGGYLYDKGDMVEPHAKEIIYSVKVLDSYGRKVFYKGAMMRNSWNDSIVESISEAIVKSAIKAAQVARDIADEAVYGGSKRVVDGLRLREKTNLGIPTPQAAFVFDALNKTTLEPITALFSARGFSAGIAAPVLSINGIAPQSNATGNTYTDIATLKKYQDAGHEIINHGLTPEGPKTVLSAADADSDANYSYELLRRAGIKVTGFVAYGGNFDAANIGYYSDRHPVVYANNVAPDERDLSLCTYGDDADVALTVTRASMENVILANGTTTTDPTEILRVCKLVVDYCAANTRSVVFYHHTITSGGLNDLQIAELVDYCTANAVDVVSTSKMWQSISNVTTQEVRLAALEKDIKRNFGLVDENLIDRENLTYWNKTLLSGAAPTETIKSTPWADSVSYAFPADNTGTAQRWALHINNVGLEKIGHGSSLCFGFDYKCNLPARNDNGTLTVKARWRSAANGGGNVQPLEHIETFSTLDIYTRRAYVVFSNLGVSDTNSKHVELIIEFTPVNGRPVTLTISNPTLNRGIIPAPYKKPTPPPTYPIPVAQGLALDTGQTTSWYAGNSSQPLTEANAYRVTLTARHTSGQIRGAINVPYAAGQATITCHAGASGYFNMVVSFSGGVFTVVSNDASSYGITLSDVTVTFKSI